MKLATSSVFLLMSLYSVTFSLSAQEPKSALLPTEQRDRSFKAADGDRLGRHVPFIALLSIVGPADASVQYPSHTKLGQALTAWLDAFNSGDHGALQAYAEKFAPKFAPKFADAIDGLIGMRKMYGNFQVVKIEKNDDNELIVLLEASDADQMFRANVKSDGTNFDIRLSGADRPAELAIARVSRDAALAAMVRRIDEWVLEDKFSGSIFLEQQGRVIFSRGWGMADRDANIPINDQTKFRLGSMPKMFTAVAALQLVDSGKISLDGTVGQYLPDYPNKEISSTVTIRQLLTHTGGTGDIFTDDWAQHRDSLRTHSDYIALYGTRAPLFNPGSQEAYSNYGFVLLGAIIEKVSGENYYDYLQDHIYAPAGMTSTGSLPEDVKVPNRSRAYSRSSGELKVDSDLPYRGMAAGGSYSTISDLAKFAHALQSAKLLPKHLLAEATSPRNAGGWYGYGFETHDKGAARYFGHGGGAPGMSADFRIFPEAETIMIVLANSDPPLANTIADYFTKRMPLTQ